MQVFGIYVRNGTVQVSRRGTRGLWLSEGIIPGGHILDSTTQRATLAFPGKSLDGPVIGNASQITLTLRTPESKYLSLTADRSSHEWLK